MSQDFDASLLQLFVDESRDHLEGIENDLMAIEERPEDPDAELVNKVFRAAHSIKGGAGIFGLEKIKVLSHHMENVLGLIRSRELNGSTPVINAILHAVDTLRNMINDNQNSESMEIENDVKALKKVMKPGLHGGESEVKEKILSVRLPGGRTILKFTNTDVEIAKKGGRRLFLLVYDLLRDIQRRGKTPIEVLKNLQRTGIVIDTLIDTASVGRLEDNFDKKDIPFYSAFATVLEKDLIQHLVEGEDADPAKVIPIEPEMLVDFVEPAAPAEKKKKAAPVSVQTAAGETVSSASAEHIEKKMLKAIQENGVLSKENSLRVSITLLDRLMSLAGELVLSRNQLSQSISEKDDKGIESATARVSNITTSLQEVVMSTRMQPVDLIFSKLRRLVRDLSEALGKQVELEIEGREVELDKNIIEGIADPLTHLVRNSLDHGLEMPDVRRAAGKNPQGRLMLHAFHEAGQVVIEVRDDGNGIDPARVKAKALEKNLLPKAELDRMKTQELIELIFLPGFSTAEKVTDVSGRGVGMDVVNSNITRLGGKVSIDSEQGKGTTVRIKLPLTLAILPALYTVVQKEIYAIPQVNLVELVRISPDQVRERIEKVDTALTMRLRGDLLPLVRLSDVLGITEKEFYDRETGTWSQDRRALLHDRRQPKDETPAEIEDKRAAERRDKVASALNIIVVNAGDVQYGLVVDYLLDTEEVVVKPLGAHLNACKNYYAGATIMGDGRVAMILDVVGICKAMKLSRVDDGKKLEKVRKSLEERKELHSLLLVRNHPDDQFAVPLGLIQRIERIQTAEIELITGRKNLKYRGGSLLLFDLEDVASVKPKPVSDSVFVLVFASHGRESGLIVSEIVDAISTDVTLDDKSFQQPGILGSAILMERTTLMVDLYGLVLEKEGVKTPAASAVGIAAAAGGSSAAANARTVLLVEDSEFFRANIRNFLVDTGYAVLCADDGVMGLKMLTEAAQVDLILTDIEMPNMNGIEMTRKLRQIDRFRNIPVIACTSVAGEEAEETGFAAGINEYLVKLDREMVLSKIRFYLGE